MGAVLRKGVSVGRSGFINKAITPASQRANIFKNTGQNYMNQARTQGQNYVNQARMEGEAALADVRMEGEAALADVRMEGEAALADVRTELDNGLVDAHTYVKDINSRAQGNQGYMRPNVDPRNYSNKVLSTVRNPRNIFMGRGIGGGLDFDMGLIILIILVLCILMVFINSYKYMTNKDILILAGILICIIGVYFKDELF